MIEQGYRVRVNSALRRDESGDWKRVVRCSYLWNCGGLFEEWSRCGGIMRGRMSDRRCPRFSNAWKNGSRRKRFAFGMIDVFDENAMELVVVVVVVVVGKKI